MYAWGLDNSKELYEGGGGGGGGFPAGRVGAGGGVAPPSPARGYGAPPQKLCNFIMKS